MYVAEFCPDGGITDTEYFETEIDAKYFCDQMNITIGKGRGMSSYWHYYFYEVPKTISPNDAILKHLK